MLLPSEVWKHEVPVFILALAHLCFGVLMSSLRVVVAVESLSRT